MSGGPVGVIGAGAWGTAFAIHLARIGAPVRLWVREEEVLSRIRSRRDNARFLPGIHVPDAVAATSSFADAAADASLVVLMVPTSFARSVYRDLAPHLSRETPVVVAAKGIEEGSLDLPLAVVRQELGEHRRGAVLSGPSFAAEVARGFLMPSEQYSYLSSTIIKDVAQNGGPLTEFLHPDVARRLEERIRSLKQ